MIDHLPVFVAATFLALVVPGPDFALVTRNTITGTRVHGYLTASGICASLVFLTVLTASGVAAVVARSDTMLTLLRVVGGTYLVLLAIQLLMGAWASGSAPAAEDTPPSVYTAKPGTRSPLVQGFLNNVLNPKALVFYLTFLPQFLNPARPIFVQTMLLGLVVASCAAVWWGCYITAIDRMGRVLRTRPARIGIDAGAGIALGTLGVLIIFGHF
jgi:threonine/homoserine/homoserine lactone efflux protein